MHIIRVPCLLRLKHSSGIQIHNAIEDFTCDPLKYIIGSPILIVLICVGNKGSDLIFISCLSYQLHCCALPDKCCLSYDMLPLSGHDDVALFE